jgi:hypothetical protein
MIRVLPRAGASFVLLALSVTLLAPQAPAAAASREKTRTAAKNPSSPPRSESFFSSDLPDPPRPGTLPDDYVMLRVGEKSIGAREFVDLYFGAYAADRPKQDSLGRVAFMKALVHKELLAQEARRLNPALTFEDRLTLREFSRRVYSNLLYQRMVIDPVRVSDQEVREAYSLFDTEVRVRMILFSTREQAERVRRDLLAARIGWSAAVQRYSLGDKANDGDLGWQSAGDIGMTFAPVTHRLKPGEISRVIKSRDGYSLVQCVERREARPPAFEAISRVLRGQLETTKSNLRADALQDSLAEQIGLVVDTTNVRWAATHFQSSTSFGSEGPTPVININAALPDFAPSDTARVLARYQGGQMSLGHFLDEFSHLPAMVRPNVNEFTALRGQVIATVIEPLIADLAIARGMDRDPVAVRQVERKHEELLVGHLYEDSVGSRIQFDPGERRRYYDENPQKFITFPEVKFAAIMRHTRAGIDSVAARVRAGESPVAILAADSMAGAITGSVQSRFQNDEGRPFHKVLFEELRPGKFWVDGPDPEGDYVLIYLLHRDDGHRVSYEEAASWIEETVVNERAEALLDAFIGRLAQRYPVQWRPDLVMRTDFRMAGI